MLPIFNYFFIQIIIHHQTRQLYTIWCINSVRLMGNSLNILKSPGARFGKTNCSKRLITIFLFLLHTLYYKYKQCCSCCIFIRIKHIILKIKFTIYICDFETRKCNTMQQLLYSMTFLHDTTSNCLFSCPY